jgi:hypothetical protein
VGLEQEIRYFLKVNRNDLEDTIRFLHAPNFTQSTLINHMTRLRWSSFSSDDDIANLKKTVQEPHSQLATLDEERTGLNEMINALRAQNEAFSAFYLFSTSLR